MRDLKNKLISSKNTKNTQSRRGKSFGYQVLGFGSGVTLIPRDPYDISFLVVAGGGAGGGGSHGGGGGAGGFRTSTQTSIATLTVITVTVGAGGTGVLNQGGSTQNGSDSSISGTDLTTITSAGGGGGGGPTNNAGANGGSGGGGTVFS